MILSTIETIPGKSFEILGLVKGASIKTVHLGKDIAAGLKTLVGGELTGYTELMAASRNKATENMIEEANSLGADAIIGIRYSTSSLMQSAAETMAYGTAIKFI